MNIQNSIHNISFGKKLEAKCSILGADKQPQECFIYKLEPHIDNDYFFSIQNKKAWKNAEYYDFIKNEMKFIEKEPYRSIYTMETPNGSCIAYGEISNRDNTYKLEILETIPIWTSKNKHETPKPKYIGETLMSFFTKKALNDGKEKINVESAIDAFDFYSQKCHFEQEENEAEYKFTLKKGNFQKLLEQNEQHTKGSINLIV